MLKQTSFLKKSSTLKKGTGLILRKSTLKGSTKIIPRSKASGRVIDGVKVWSLDEADKKIREYIFNRDGHKCVVTGDKDFLTLSHYHGRGNYAVRFDPDNLISLNLWTHQIWETKEMKDTEYKDFMIKFIGKDRFNALNAKAKHSVKKEDSIIGCMRFLGALTDKQ